MNEYSIFLIGTMFFIGLSRHALRKPRSHGFYRFIAFECVLALVLVNFPMWQVEPLSPRQIASWIVLQGSLLLVIHAVYLLGSVGRPNTSRSDAELLPFERTSALVTVGAYRYIRHPMYAALLMFAVGAYLKHISLASTLLISGTGVALLFTALRDEVECCEYFGEAYVRYMKTSKRFVPFIF